MAESFDSSWEKTIYQEGRQINRYPFSDLVSYVMRAYAARLRAGETLRVLELGCGTGNNLAFLAREGFVATGIEGAATACAIARDNLAAQGLAAEIVQGDFVRLPFPENHFDLVIDRAAVYCNRKAAIAQTVREVHRCLTPGGRFISFVFGAGHGGGGAEAVELEPGTYTDFPSGPFAGTGTAHLFTEDEVRHDYLTGFEIEFIDAARLERLLPAASPYHAEYRICGRKPV